MLPNGIIVHENDGGQKLWEFKELKINSEIRRDLTANESTFQLLKGKTVDKFSEKTLKPSESLVISSLKPLDSYYNVTLSGKGTNKAFELNQPTLSTMNRLSSVQSINQSESPPIKKWRFDKNIKTNEAIEYSPGIKAFSPKSEDEMRKFSLNVLNMDFDVPSKRTDGNEIYEFLKYEGDESEEIQPEFQLKTKKKDQNQKNERATSMQKFLENKRFFNYLNRGTAEDLKMIEKCFQEDPSKFLYERLDEKSLANKPNKIGQRPLYIAAKNGNLNLVKMLVHYGADPKLISLVRLPNGTEINDSVLGAAARWNNLEMVEYLLKEFSWERGEKISAASHSNSPSIKQVLLKKDDGINPGELANSLVLCSELQKGNIYNKKQRINPRKKKEKESFFKVLFSCFGSKKKKSH